MAAFCSKTLFPQWLRCSPEQAWLVQFLSATNVTLMLFSYLRHFIFSGHSVRSYPSCTLLIIQSSQFSWLFFSRQQMTKAGHEFSSKDYILCDRISLCCSLDAILSRGKKSHLRGSFACWGLIFCHLSVRYTPALLGIGWARQLTRWQDTSLSPSFGATGSHVLWQKLQAS